MKKPNPSLLKKVKTHMAKPLDSIANAVKNKSKVAVYDPIENRRQQVEYQKFILEKMNASSGEDFKIWNAEFDRIQQKIDGIDRITAQAE